MRKIVCSSLGNIYYATSDRNRVDVTNDAVDAVFYHIISMEKYDREGYAGYKIPKRDGKEVWVCVFDTDKYELKRK